MLRFVAAIEYDGTSYHGWQRQKDTRATVQEKVEDALSQVANEPIRVICAGRTDAGVHALEQIIHFDTEVERPERAWVFGTNSNLPHDISLRWIKAAPDDFHARFSAVAREYKYYIYNQPIRSALYRHTATWYCAPLDEERMQQAANKLIGEHDFSSFRAKSCQAHSPIRTIDFIHVTRQDDMLCINIKANAFLHHMVRNIAGVLMAIGSGKEPISWVDKLLEVKSREQGGVTALPNGLHFVKAFYLFLL
jgi:tRNA pseudouridine38-40 synthase